MGGIGKTTVAKAIYNEIRHKFVYKSFLENIREVWEKDRGQIHLQEQLLSNILKNEKTKIPSIECWKNLIKERICNKKVLLVLDDVNKLVQLSALCGDRNWIGLGNVVIITTRDALMLKFLEVDYAYEMKEMETKESLQLFSWHAFKESSPRENFIELSTKVVANCGGLPLALEVLGSYLYGRAKQEWKSVLLKLEKHLNEEVKEKLQISFDYLKDQTVKDIFLDIRFFFIGKDRAYVADILNGCGFHAEIGIAVLIERSLLKVDKNNKLEVHSLLRDMGRDIIYYDNSHDRCYESLHDKLGKRSRLWFQKDVVEVQRENTGTKAIEGLALKLENTSEVCFSTSAFKKMKRLRLLKLDNVQLVGDYKYLPKSLKWLYWRGFPLKYIPSSFSLDCVVVIDLKHSKLELVWKEPQLLEWLKILNLSHCKYLSNTPIFSKLPNLEKLILKDCPRLCKVHESIGDLCNLLLINLKDCTRLSHLPRTIYKLKSLKTLNLSGCSKINNLEEDIVQMESLTTLIANNSAIREVPLSILRLKSIEYISICGYEGLAHDIFPSLIRSWKSPTINHVSRINTVSLFPSSIMDLQTSNLNVLLPMRSLFSKLRTLLVQCRSEYQLTQERRKLLEGVFGVSFTEQLEASPYASQILEKLLGSRLVGMRSCELDINVPGGSMSQTRMQSSYTAEPTSATIVRYVDKKCYCGKRAAIQCSESEDNKSYMYYNCQDKRCNFFDCLRPLNDGVDEDNQNVFSGQATMGENESEIVHVLRELSREVGVLTQQMNDAMKFHKFWVYILSLAIGFLCLCMFLILCVCVCVCVCVSLARKA